MSKAIAYIDKLRKLLRLEYEAEKSSFLQIRDRAAIENLQARGQAFINIRPGRSYINALNQRIFEVFIPLDEDATETEHDHLFEPGLPVMFFTLGYHDNVPSVKFSGVVSFVDKDRIAVRIPDGASPASIIGTDSAGIMLSFDETSYQAMFDTLNRVENASGRLAELRDLFYSNNPARFLSFSSLSFPYLNYSQQEAINKILSAKDVAIVHGPPGTGKTTTLVESIHETLMREPQVMVCAQSNMAVDWICEKLVERGVNVLRIGNPSRVNDNMLSFTYERRFEAHPDYPLLWKIRRDINSLRHSHSHSESYHQRMDRLKGRATELEFKINTDIFGQARVVASTLVGSANKILTGKRFSSLFIDEAAQALEPACWIPIRRAGRVILAGDHCQLPATVKCYDALKQGLGISLMERLVNSHPECVSLLTMQYRMNRHIMEFSSNWFYDSRMVAAPSVADRNILDLDAPIEWLDTDGIISLDDKDDSPDSPDDDSLFNESVTKSGVGRINRDEALLTMLALRNYCARIGMQRIIDEHIDFGVISPYRAQVNYLRHLIKRIPELKRIRKFITINTIDGFQGQERDVIIISMVRSNVKGNIGFLRDLRRMNVAITRARNKVIIIANAPTLTRHPFYKALLSHISNISSLNY